MIFEKKRNALGLLVVISAFLISRFLYDRAGIVFDATYMFGWQVIDPALLKTDVLRSVFYLHSQPPLWNLFLGAGMQIFPKDYLAIFNSVYYAFGIVVAVSLYQLGLFLRFPNWLAAVAAILFAVSPSAILYENMISYAYPLTALLTLSGVVLYRFIETKQTRWGALFFFLLAVMALTWSLFHLVWLLGAAAILYAAWSERKKVVLAALLPALIVASWYAKNWVIAGDFTASSWAGMNLSRIVTFRVPEEERAALVKADKLSPFALIPPFRNPNVYLELLPATPKTGIAVLDAPETSLNTRNHHHLVYAEASRYYLKDALRLILMKPQVYLRGVFQAIYIYFHSASDYEFLDSNRARIETLDQIWNRAIYGQWQSGEEPGERLNRLAPSHVGWWILLGYIAAAASGLNLLRKSRRQHAEPVYVLIFFMLYNLLFVALVGSAMDIGENNRFRFTVDPFLTMLALFALWNVTKRKFTSPAASE